MSHVKINDFDRKDSWKEFITIDRFYKLMQGDVQKNLVRFWKNNKDLPPTQLWGIEQYENHELEARQKLALASGANPKAAIQVNTLGQINNEHRPSIHNHAIAASAIHEMERNDSKSKVFESSEINSTMFQKEEINESHLKSEGNLVPKLEIVNMSFQEVKHVPMSEKPHLSEIIEHSNNMVSTHMTTTVSKISPEHPISDSKDKKMIHSVPLTINSIDSNHS